MSESSEIQVAYRSLWSSAVLQALEDIENQPIPSTEYAEAEAFFIRPGAWARSRNTIADILDMHPGQLEMIGRRRIEARRVADMLAETAAKPS